MSVRVESRTMPDCDYCGESFDDDDAYARHLRDEHPDDLSRIEQRRVDDLEGESRDLPTGPIVLVGIVALGIVVVVYALFLAGGGGTATATADQTPYALNSVHEHGPITMTVLGERVDFSQSEYQVQDNSIHFEARNGVMWHKHAQGATLEYFMATLGINVTDDSVTYQGTTYDDDDPQYDVSITVDGEPVDPSTHILQGAASERTFRQGDTVEIVVESASSS
ncbi:hypothetical protein BRD17_03900 [Halobacteriales archaeon SW_7_68_16]|nr:MAG: hypothetical protein BRD17_03900 [Halobacteriales archaeon SW_7_68_16]